MIDLEEEVVNGTMNFLHFAICTHYKYTADLLDIILDKTTNEIEVVGKVLEDQKMQDEIEEKMALKDASKHKGTLSRLRPVSGVPSATFIDEKCKKKIRHQQQQLHNWLKQTFMSDLRITEDGLKAFEYRTGSYYCFQGMNILHLAIIFYPELVSPLLRFLRQQNLDQDMVNQETEWTKVTPLHLAVKKGSMVNHKVDITRLLIDYGADPKKENLWKEVPLHLAESPAVVDLLLLEPEK